MTDVPDGCTLVTEPYWPCEDIWPPGTLSKAAIAAYKRLQQHGQITIERVFYNKQTDVTRFKYLSMESGDALKTKLRKAMEEVKPTCELRKDGSLNECTTTSNS